MVVWRVFRLDGVVGANPMMMNFWRNTLDHDANRPVRLSLHLYLGKIRSKGSEVEK